jgi:hypothetical protein
VLDRKTVHPEARRSDRVSENHILSRRFRNVYLRHLGQAYAAGKLRFHGDLQPLSDPSSFARYLAPLHEMEWMVYA